MLNNLFKITLLLSGSAKMQVHTCLILKLVFFSFFFHPNVRGMFGIFTISQVELCTAYFPVIYPFYREL